MDTTTHAHHPALSKAEQKHEQLVTQTRKWVAQTFYGPVLKSMRNSPFKDKMFSGGRGGEAFQQMFDQKLADHMSSASGNKLVNSIVDKIESAQDRSGKPHGKKHHVSGVTSSRLNLRA